MRHFPRVLAWSTAGTWVVLLLVSRSGLVERHPPAPARPELETGKHYPTPKQLVESGDFADRHMPSFTARVHDGSRYDWPAMTGSRPLVLVFIKRDCPCNVEFEPLFRRLEEQYTDVADFAGVIDSDTGAAQSYVTTNRLSHRVLADPARTIIDRFGARNGGYVALLRAEGKIEALWPGWSDEMIRELGHRIAVLARIADRPIDVTGAPHVLTTGCPYSS